jgi:Adenosine deaminase
MVTENARRLSDTPAEEVDMLWRLPKVELHLHLTGAIRPATVCAQARRYEPDSPFCYDGWQAGFWSFSDLRTALAALRQVTQIALRSADDYYLVARECFEDLAAQQVIYAEVSVGQPRHPPGHPHYVSLPDTLAAPPTPTTSIRPQWWNSPKRCAAPPADTAVPLGDLVHNTVAPMPKVLAKQDHQKSGRRQS